MRNGVQHRSSSDSRDKLMTATDRNIGFGFLYCYLYFAISVALGVNGVDFESEFAEAISTACLMIFLVLAAVAAKGRSYN